MQVKSVLTRTLTYVLVREQKLRFSLMFNYKKKHLTNTKHKMVVELSALTLFQKNVKHDNSKAIYLTDS